MRTAQARRQLERPLSRIEIVFEVREDDLDGGHSTSALSSGIRVQTEDGSLAEPVNDFETVTIAIY